MKNLFSNQRSWHLKVSRQKIIKKYMYNNFTISSSIKWDYKHEWPQIELIALMSETAKQNRQMYLCKTQNSCMNNWQPKNIQCRAQEPLKTYCKKWGGNCNAIAYFLRKNGE